MSVTLLRISDVCRRTGLARSTIYERMADGKFPKQVKISPFTARWRSDVIDAWIEEVSKHTRPDKKY